MDKPESRIVEALIAYIKSQGGDAWKVHGSVYQRKGEPDIDGWLPALHHSIRVYTSNEGEHENIIHKIPLHLKIEVKVPGKEPDPLQARRLAEYKIGGYVAGAVTSVSGLIQLVEEFKTRELRNARKHLG